MGEFEKRLSIDHISSKFLHKKSNFVGNFQLILFDMGESGGGGAAGNWCLIESDPVVFTELIQKFGCTGMQVEELWSLDESQFGDLKPVHGLVFLFKWVPDENPQGTVVLDDRANQMFFARQVIQNACATQAILSVLLHNEGTGALQLGRNPDGAQLVLEAEPLRVRPENGDQRRRRVSLCELRSHQR